MSNYTFAPVHNYYGEPFVYEADGQPYLALNCVTGEQRVAVSRHFYDAFVAEFADENGR